MRLCIFSLRFLLFFTASFYLFSTFCIHGQSAAGARLKEPVSITLGQNQVSLPAGTTVQVLQQNSGKATVSLKLQDGSPVITQIPIGSLEFLSGNQGAAVSGEQSPSTINNVPSGSTAVESRPATFCNPLDLPYRFESGPVRREAADPT